ncbi:MAG TPA: hypothetical protein VGM60_20065 [Pseudonocardia sp.]|uniref:hypothetical protein n=1 Tax=Pseudonocardia sp. TaxID=60912 RepID=UPI002F3F3BB5
MLVTFSGPIRCASSAACQPVPVPISNTRSPGCACSSSSIPATTDGWEEEEVTSHPVPSSAGCPSSTWVLTASSA